MQKRKKTVSILLLLVMILTLAACNKDDTQASVRGMTAEDGTAPASAWTSQAAAIWKETNDSNRIAKTIDWTDENQVKAYVETTAGIYQKYLDLEIDKADKGRGKILQAGAKEMIEYLNALPDFCELDKNSADYEKKKDELSQKYIDAQRKLIDVLPAIDVEPQAPAETEETEKEA